MYKNKTFLAIIPARAGSKRLPNKKYFRFGPTILTFAINLRKPEAKRWMKGFKTIPFKTSFGSEETKLDPWPYEIDGITYCRLAIGYNTNVEELIKDFTIALSKMK